MAGFRRQSGCSAALPLHNSGNRPEDAEADLHFSAPRYGCAAATLRQLGLALLAGAFLALHFALWIRSLALTSVASSTVLVTTNPIWIVMGTIEGLFFALFISWYDTSFTHSTGFASSMLAKVGEYSYSIYLLHMFFVFSVARFIHENIMDISNFYIALAWALVCFGLMLPIAGASYRFIEMPFMKWRRSYIRTEKY